MVIDRDLFGLARRTGGDRTPARQLDFKEALCLTVSVKSGGATAPFHFQLWSGTEGNPMGTHTKTLATSEAVGARWSAWLRRAYPGPHAVKRVARAFEIDTRTAESWIGGQAPYARHFVKAAALHGPAVLFEVLAPGLVPPSDEETRRALAEVKGELDRLGSRLSRLTIEVAAPGAARTKAGDGEASR